MPCTLGKIRILDDFRTVYPQNKQAKQSCKHTITQTHTHTHIILHNMLSTFLEVHGEKYLLYHMTLNNPQKYTLKITLVHWGQYIKDWVLNR